MEFLKIEFTFTNFETFPIAKKNLIILKKKETKNSRIQEKF